MPTEMRVLMYTDHEVVGSLAAFYRRAGRPLTVGTIRNYTIRETDNGVGVDLAVETIDGEVVEHAIAENDLAAALIMDAIKRKIPLPAEADKRLYVIENHVTLIVHKRRTRSDPTRIRGPNGR